MERFFISAAILFMFAVSGLLAQQKADPQRLYDHVAVLCGREPARSVIAPASLDSAARYISSVLRRFSDRVIEQPYTVAEGEVRNIIASFGPVDGPRIVIGAHYDVAGEQPGADDNASGVSGMLELARLLSSDSSSLPLRIDLAAYTLEEPPYFRTNDMGSYRHAHALKDSGVAVRIMLSLEMIGYFRDEDHSQGYPVKAMHWIYPDAGNFITVVSNIPSLWSAGSFASRMEERCAVPVQWLCAPAFVTGVDFSDHLNFWECGYDAVMITDTAFLRNHHYHTASDTPQELDYRRMAEVVTGVYHAVTHW